MKIDKAKHRGQLTIGQLMERIKEIQLAHPNDWMDIPVYLGDDDEFNGVHCGWYSDYVPEGDEDESGFRETINETACNNELGEEEVALLIS